MITMEPVNMRDSLVFSGKYGSLTPVTGFCSIVGAMAANSGRGRSLKKTVTIITGHTLHRLCLVHRLVCNFSLCSVVYLVYSVQN